MSLFLGTFCFTPLGEAKGRKKKIRQRGEGRCAGPGGTSCDTPFEGGKWGGYVVEATYTQGALFGTGCQDLGLSPLSPPEDVTSLTIMKGEVTFSPLLFVWEKGEKGEKQVPRSHAYHWSSYTSLLLRNVTVTLQAKEIFLAHNKTHNNRRPLWQQNSKHHSRNGERTSTTVVDGTMRTFPV